MNSYDEPGNWMMRFDQGRRSAAVTEYAGKVAEAFRFLFHDIWSGDWDHHRRSLFFRHYWSYLRHPPIPSRWLPAPNERVASEAAQAEFSAGFLRAIEYAQSKSARAAGVYLTYRPLGKNLRLLGTAVRNNARRGRATYVRRGGPPSEEQALARRGQRWSPWLWGRSGDDRSLPGEAAADSAAAWNALFRQPAPRTSSRTSGEKPSIACLRRGYGPFDAAGLERALEMAVATRFVFQPVDSILQEVRRQKEKMGWPSAGVPVLGIHVRRGDAAATAGDVTVPQKSTRASFPLATYLDASDRLCDAYGIRHIFLGTESRHEIERARELRPHYHFHFLDYDRSNFPDLATSNQFIEDLALSEPSRVPVLTASAILDLYFFCECSAFVGAFNSEFSVLAWLLASGSRGAIVPYVSLSEPILSKSVHPLTALLNVKNNCSLELYHW